VGKCCHLSTIW